MQISISNPVQSTIIFVILLALALFLFIKPKKESGLSISTSQELKGFAILAVIFSHIGYFLFTDHAFLFPLSILAGVGVNIFLFLSGYGLTISKLKKRGKCWSILQKAFIKII